MCILQVWLTDVGTKISSPIRWLLIGLFFVSVQIMPLLAQDPTNNYCTNPLGAAEGGFTLDKTRICPGDKISVVGGIPSDLSNIAYIADYQGNGIPTGSLQLTGIFTYSQPGTYTILQVGSRNGTRAVKCQTVTVLPLDPVQFTLKACTGRQVTILVNAATLGQYDTYVVNWNDGTIPVEMSRAELAANPQHIYAPNTGGAPNITVEGVYGSLNIPICRSPNYQVVILASDITQPVIKSLKAVDANTITVQYDVGAASPVQLYQKVNGAYAAEGPSTVGPGTFTVKTNAKQVQCFKVISKDVCGSTSLESDEVCSLVVDAKATNRKNTLSWQPYTSASTKTQFQNYRILRNDSPLGTSISTQNTTTYTDVDVVCGMQYCYRLVATITTSSTATGTTQTEITSAPSCVTGINGNALDSLGTLVVSVENNHPSLVANLPATGTPSSYTLLVTRADGASGTYNPVTTLVDKNTFVDNSANASSGSYCYQVKYEGGCNLGLPISKPVCTIYLSSSAKASMNWTAESPFAPGSIGDYVVELVDSANAISRKKSVGITTHYDRQANEVIYTYRIIATSGGHTSYSNYITFPRDDRFSIPDAFTPNGDKWNDEFVPKGVNADQFLMNIYSRWGEILYSTTDKTKGWDGTIKGQTASPGEYIYHIEIKDTIGQKTVRTGTLLLIR